jgi:hypothetical protein
MESTNKYPRFINNTPCGVDLFEGKSQQKIANNICNIIKTEESCNIIGIDGGWGSGKSNLVKQVENILPKENYHFFVYDAWGHQEDLQRRSFLEELTENLTQESLVKEVWKSKLNQLLAKAKKTESKRTPKLSIGIIVAGIAILITPLFKSIADKIEKLEKLPHHYLWSLGILSIPLLLVIGLFVYFFYQEKEGSKIEKLKRAFTRLFLEYQNKLEEETKYEMISEEEPSVRKFRNWMTEISKDLGKKNLILVFDNMDRLPQKKVQELWSSIHVFFSEHSYNNIKVIIPFDREHIKLAFKSEDIANKQYGDDFINKTFNVVYRVSPPILSDWKNYFTTQWKEAFGEEDSLSNSSNVLQIFDLLCEEITPRRIIAFINEFVSIKHTIKNSVPNNYIALFILGKSVIVKRPIDEILHPTYLKGLSYLYADDEEIPKFIAALFYQVEPDKAIQIVFTDKIKRALNENLVGELEKISSIPEFYDVLENAIADVSNYENAILALGNLPIGKIGDKYQSEIIWNSLYKKIAPRAKSQISEFQLVLLSKISKQREYLNFILDDLLADSSFSSTSYFESINAIGNKFKDTLPVFSELKTKKTSVQDFIDFISKAKSDFAKYKIKTDQKELNDYLIALEIPKLKEVDFLPYLKEEYSFITFTKKLEELIKVNSPNNDKEVMSVLFSRYKEVCKERPLKAKMEDSSVYSLFTNSTDNEEFYYDLLAMRIAKLDKFEPSYIASFDTPLQSNDKEIIEKVSSRLEYFIDYDDILLGLENFKGNLLYIEIAKYLTINDNHISRAEVDNLIKHFKAVCENGKLEPKILLKRLNDLDTLLSEEITRENAKEIVNPFFLEHAINENLPICQNCIGKVNDYLNSLTEDKWSEAFKDLKSYEIEVSLIINYKFSINAFESFKDILKDIAVGSLSLPDRCIIEKLINKLEEQGKSLKATFNTVRDSICNANSMTIPLFKFLGDWLFKYSDIAGNHSSLRTIFIADVIRDNECLQILLNNQEKMPAIISAANEEAQDFKEIIKDLLLHDQSESLVSFANSIGVEIVKNNEPLTDSETKV